MAAPLVDVLAHQQSATQALHKEVILLGGYNQVAVKLTAIQRLVLNQAQNVAPRTRHEYRFAAVGVRVQARPIHDVQPGGYIVA